MFKEDSNLESDASTPKQNLHAFINANLIPVAKCIQKEEGCDLDLAKIIARREITTEWGNSAKELSRRAIIGQLGILSLTTLTFVFGTIANMGAALYYHTGSMVYSAGLQNLANTGAIVGCLGSTLLSIKVAKLARQFHKKPKSINADDEENKAVYARTRNNILRKYQGIELAPT
jgi:hypothetical protein